MTTQHDMVISNDTRTAVRADLNAALLAIASQHEGAADPGTLYKYQRRARTDLGVVLRRNASNSGDLLDGTLAETLVVAKSGAFTAGLADYQRTFICTGTWSMAFAAAATLRDGWWCGIKNNGAGVITLNPDGAETIDGGATLDLAAGQSCVVCCDGVGLYVIGVLGISQSAFDVAKKNVGEIFMHLGDAAPAGALIVPVAATAISRAAYPALHAFCAALAYPWGTGDGSTTFGMPYVAADEALVQANGNVRSTTVGQVMSHTHNVPATTAGGTNGFVAALGYETSNGNIPSATSGGTKNLAAGVRVLLCIQYQ